MFEQGSGKIIIKNYGLMGEQQQAIRRISVQNSIFNDYKGELLSEEIIADLLTSYFLEYEPEFCFVAEEEGMVIGYLLGSVNIIKMHRIIKSKNILRLTRKVLQDGLILRPSNLKLIKSSVSSYMKGEFKVPAFAKDYPATLHVNIAAEYRGKMMGTMLVTHFLELLKRKGISGIHFGVLSERAKKFFLKLDFKVLYSGEYTFLKFLSGETLPHYIMGKKI